VGGTGGFTDAGSPQDACADAVWYRFVIASVNTADMVDCAIPVKSMVPGSCINGVVVKCTDIRGTAPSSDGWTIDDTTDPVRLVFGATLCEQVRMEGEVPVYLYCIHSIIM
jgi:hypothetical protein